MDNYVHPNQISLFDSVQNRCVLERERERESRNPRHITFNSIISFENLLISWQEFLRGKKRRKDVAEFSVSIMDNILALHSELKEKNYKHGLYHAFKINDPKPRDIHKASVRDRIVHHAIYRILYPYFERKFIYDSYSCRLDKGTHNAINRLRNMARKVSRNNTRTTWISKGDIRKFFANINHQILKNILKEHIKDNYVLWLTENVIDSFSTVNDTRIGLPLGNITSQLFINVYMNKLDQFVKRELKVQYYIRYCDDFVILHHSKPYLINIISEISHYLEGHLRLTLNRDKVLIKPLLTGVDFLGWVHFPHHLVLRTSTKRRMFKRLLDKHSNESVNSYLGLLRHGNAYKLMRAVQENYSNYPDV